MAQSTLPVITDRGRRVLRTTVQVGIPAFLLLAVLLPVALDALKIPDGSKLHVVLYGTAAVITAAAALLTHLMASPRFDAVLTVLGIGSVPSSQVQLSLREGVTETADVFQALAPEIEAALPASTAVLEPVEDAVAAIQAKLAEDPVETHSVAIAQ